MKNEIRQSLNLSLPSNEFNAALRAAVRWAIASKLNPKDIDVVDAWVLDLVRRAITDTA